MGDTELRTFADELDEPRESRWHDAGMGKRWHYFQYRPGDRVFYTGNPKLQGLVVTSPDQEGVTWVQWDDSKQAHLAQGKPLAIGAWNVRPAHLTITEDPV